MTEFEKLMFKWECLGEQIDALLKDAEDILFNSVSGAVIA